MKDKSVRLKSPSFQEIEALKVEDRYSVQTRDKIAQLAGIKHEPEKSIFIDRCLGFTWQLCHDLELEKMPDASKQRLALKNLSKSLQSSLEAIRNLDEISYERLEVTAAYKKALQDTSPESRGAIWSEKKTIINESGSIIKVHEGFPPSDIKDDENARLKEIFASEWHRTADGFMHINKNHLIRRATSAIQDMRSWAETATEVVPVRRGRHPKAAIRKAIKNLTGIWRFYKSSTISRDTDQNTKKGDYLEFLELLLEPVLSVDLKERYSIASMASEIVYPRKSTQKKP